MLNIGIGYLFFISLTFLSLLFDCFRFFSIDININIVIAILVGVLIFGIKKIKPSLNINYGLVLFLLIYTGFRILIPDWNFDTRNYHIYIQENFFKDNINYHFFPAGRGTFSMPLGDTMFYFFRYFLGYRAGTILNTICLYVICEQLLKYLEKYKVKNIFKIIGIVGIISTEYILSNLGTYMVDLLTIPFLLEIIRVLEINNSNVKIVPKKEKVWIYSYLFLLAGICFSLKIINLIFLLPIFIVYVIFNYKKYDFKIIFIVLPLFFLPILFYGLQSYKMTGNPIYPYFNNIFKSDYFLKRYFSDEPWKFKGWKEFVLWPFIIYKFPRRFSELGLYSGRLSLGYIFIIFIFLIGLVKKQKNKLKDKKYIIFIMSLFLWIYMVSYVRYMLPLEILCGILVIDYLCRKENKRIIKIGIGVIFSFQIIMSHYYFLIKNIDWSYRKNIFFSTQLMKQNYNLLFNDKEINSAEDLSNVDNWLIIGMNGGLISLVNKQNAPMYRLDSDWMEPNVYEKELKKRLKNYEEKYTLITNEQLEFTLNTLVENKFLLKEIKQLNLPFVDALKTSYLLKFKENKETKIKRNIPYIVLDGEGKIYEIDQIEGKKNIKFKAGMDPVIKGIISDGARIYISRKNVVSNEEKILGDIYIYPDFDFKDVEIELEDLKEDDVINLYYKNDEGKHWNADFLLLIDVNIY